MARSGRVRFGAAVALAVAAHAPRVSALELEFEQPVPCPTDEVFAGVRWAFTEELKRLEVLLERSPFLVGSCVTAADCVCFQRARRSG